MASYRGRVADEQIDVVDVPTDRRFEILVEGKRAGFAEYARRGDRVIFTHTEIDPAYEGRGLGSKLARGVLDHARTAGDAVVPLCPFIEGFVEKHDQYADLVDQECLAYLERKRATA
jgi:predicted GNAT family acetyltransferase